MSQNRELEFIEAEPGRWFYVLEDSSAPKDSWDWHDYATAYGPFTSYEKAREHQYDLSRISTPGSTVHEYKDVKITPVLRKLIAGATLDRAW